MAAGASQRSPVEEASSESMDALFALNVEGTLRLNRVLLPRLLAQAEKEGGGCRIVVIGSMASQVGNPPLPSLSSNSAKGTLRVEIMLLSSPYWFGCGSELREKRGAERKYCECGCRIWDTDYPEAISRGELLCTPHAI